MRRWFLLLPSLAVGLGLVAARPASAGCTYWDCSYIYNCIQRYTENCPPTTTPFVASAFAKNGGATNAMVSTGNLMEHGMGANDYGLVSNTVLTRLGAVLAAVGLAGTIIIASRMGLRYVQSRVGGTI